MLQHVFDYKVSPQQPRINSKIGEEIIANIEDSIEDILERAYLTIGIVEWIEEDLLDLT